jgi:hypothetical protein
MSPESLLPADDLGAFRAKLGDSILHDVVAEAEAVVMTSSRLTPLSVEHQRRLSRALARAELFNLMGAVPEAVAQTAEAARAELASLRQGHWSEPAAPAIVEDSARASNRHGYTRADQEGL